MDANVDDRTLVEAARWFARLRASDCSVADREAFEHWRDADPSHAAAYARAHRASAAVDELLARDSRIQAMLDQAILAPLQGADEALEACVTNDASASAANAAASSPKPSRRWKIPAAIAASVVLALGCARRPCS